MTAPCVLVRVRCRLEFGGRTLLADISAAPVPIEGELTTAFCVLTG